MRHEMLTNEILTNEMLMSRWCIGDGVSLITPRPVPVAYGGFCCVG